jgi:hypothetical protein
VQARGSQARCRQLQGTEPECMGSGEMRGKRMRWWAAGQWSNLVGFKIFHHAVDVLECGHSVFFTLSFHRRGLRNGVN